MSCEEEGARRGSRRAARCSASILLGGMALFWTACVPEQDLPLPSEPEMGAPAIQYVIASDNQQYTTDAQFNEGTLVNVNHDTPTDNQLQLNRASGTFPFIWIALSQRCTIAKVNTATGAILGEYRTVADQAGCSESSRTTVSIDGSVWVGHRGAGGVTHVGLRELNQCVDRNGNGVIDTSTGYGDVRPWTGGAPSPVANAQDECILHHVDTDALGFAETRHMSISAGNRLWVGSFVSRRFVGINGTTGAVETPVKTGFPCGGYGGLIDKNGVIWSANGGSNGLLRWDPNAPDAAGVNPRCINIPVYGLAIDPAGWIWASVLSGGVVRKVSPDGNTILGPFSHGSSSAQGLAVDSKGDVWVSSSLFCSGAGCTIGHLKNDGTFVGNVANPTGGGSTGVSVDANGNIWSANRNSNTATRINPNAGPPGADGVTPIGAVDLTVSFPSTPGRPLPFPYNYSDMTGAQLFSSTAPQGSWTVTQDGGEAGNQWNKITWNTEAQGFIPAGGSIVVEARAADTEAGLGSQTFVVVSNGAPFTLVGRFIQVRVTLRAASDGTSPILSDIRIEAASAGDSGAPFCALTATGTNASGRKFIQVTTRDSGTGLQSIVVTKATNLDAVVPPFTPGTTGNVVVTATKIDQVKSSQLALRVTDVQGNVTDCDPVDVTIGPETRWGSLKILGGIPAAEGTVTITNGSPGLGSVVVVVNGTRFEAAGLQHGEVRTLNVASAMRPGDNNTFVLRAVGGRGAASANVLIWDGVGTPPQMASSRRGRLSS